MKRKSYAIKNLGQNINRKKKQRRTMIDSNQSSVTDVDPSTSTTNTNEVRSPLVSNITTSSLSSSQSMPFMDVPSFMMMKMKKRCAALSLRLTRDPSVLLSNYSTMTNETFKDVLFHFIQATASKQVKDQSSSLLKSLDHDEVVTYLRQWTHLKNMASYFQLQIEQWSHYLHVGITENIWTGRMVLKNAIKNSIRPSYGRRKHLIEQRLKIYQQKLQKMNEDLLTHLEQRPVLLTDCDEMIKVIDHLVNRDQSELRIDLKRRQTLLKLDAQDHQLLQAFYSLKPKQAQIQTARKVWKAVHDEQTLRYEIEMFEIWLSHRSSSSTIFPLTNLHLTTINHLLIRTMFDHSLDLTSLMKSSDDNAHEQMVRCVADKAIIAAQVLLDSYQCKAMREKMKLLNRKPKNQDVVLHEQIMNAMENRQQQLIHRMKYDMKQKQCLFR